MSKTVTYHNSNSKVDLQARITKPQFKHIDMLLLRQVGC